ncbi:hypothetical protein OW492_00320 [Psychromonas sp. 14N.309.X.WAT.B.A12]|uniref:hypothetical protein n=1 Tax=Psychromonas sp. 14N.309.X.WAT.B.A12 TaxID=2998322 RepID=UPI0025B142F7|nr:hypothetical protein [Psychromonas sp. 14N.309.X.WAT.B.A12]MDN2661815.1 hypothetical protein [Psychromonas sp. 14N.309.X.WAT.B.A12]
MSKTNIDNFIGELESGIFKEKLSHMLSDVALGQVIHSGGNRKGKVNIELTFSQVGDNNQVIIASKLSHTTITKRGMKSEQTTTETPMYVGKGGVLTIDQPKEELTGQFNLTAVSQ